MPDRFDHVTITTKRALVVISWDCREQLLRRLDLFEDTQLIRAAFRAVGASQPVKLTQADEETLFIGLNEWARDLGEADDLPEGLWGLRNALADQFHETGRGP